MKKRSTGPYKNKEPLCDQSQYSVSQLRIISKKVTCLVEFQVRFLFSIHSGLTIERNDKFVQ